MGLLDLVTQALAGGSTNTQHVDAAAQAAPPNVLASALAHAFGSDQTPSIGAIVGGLFGNSNGQQQAGMLNQILATLGPVVASGLAGGVLSKVLAPGATQITPAQASQLTPQQVQDVVEHAHQSNPGIAQDLASFYAQHSGLIKTLGGAALAVTLSKLKDHAAQA